MAKDINITEETFSILEKIENQEKIDPSFIQSIFPKLTSETLETFIKEERLENNKEAEEIQKMLLAVETSEKLKSTYGTKTQLVKKIATDAQISKLAAEYAFSAIVRILSNALVQGEKVTIRGLGTFSVSKRATMGGRNPQTGAPIKIKAKKIAKFKADRNLTEKIK